MSISAVALTPAPTVDPQTIEISVVTVSGFTRSPSSLNVTIGETATFHCQHQNAFNASWRLSETILEPPNTPPGIIINSVALPGGGGLQHMLTTIACLENNTTKFDCVLPNLQTVSTSALLKVQGQIS